MPGMWLTCFAYYQGKCILSKLYAGVKEGLPFQFLVVSLYPLPLFFTLLISCFGQVESLNDNNRKGEFCFRIIKFFICSGMISCKKDELFLKSWDHRLGTSFLHRKALSSHSFQLLCSVTAIQNSYLHICLSMHVLGLDTNQHLSLYMHYRHVDFCLAYFVQTRI